MSANIIQGDFAAPPAGSFAGHTPMMQRDLFRVKYCNYSGPSDSSTF